MPQVCQRPHNPIITPGRILLGHANNQEAQTRYSPPICVGAKRREITGRPDPAHISTSYAEQRSNLSIRMGLRRFTRLTNAFSKKVENHIYALSIYFMHYNFVRIHQTIRVTPAMAAMVTDRLWELADIVRVVDDGEAAQKAAYY
jgi:hypothetical protein